MMAQGEEKRIAKPVQRQGQDQCQHHPQGLRLEGRVGMHKGQQDAWGPVDLASHSAPSTYWLGHPGKTTEPL